MKKTDQITFRCSEELKKELQKIADFYKWTLSFTAEQILLKYIENPTALR